jgi:demethoxyubiquinone hydroxylase (CLK1/Coq7/Cat5 family)
MPRNLYSSTKRLIRKLKIAHAIEIGAFYAYEGHASSIKNNPTVKQKIIDIQDDEVVHMNDIESMLYQLGSKPSPILDALLWAIGSVISLSCHVMGYRMAMWGAGVMEKMGGVVYKDLAKVAEEAGWDSMGAALCIMQDAEEDHERFFKEILK